MELHRAASEALAHTVDDQEKENVKLEQRIVELEATPSPISLFSKPLSIVQSIEDYLGQSWKFDKITYLLLGVRILL